MAALARQAEHAELTWSSHRLPYDDFFTAAEEHILKDFPEIVLVKLEAEFDNTKRALQEAAAWVVQHHKDLVPSEVHKIRTHFVVTLEKEKSALAPETAWALHNAITMLQDPSASRDHHLLATWTLALTHLRCHKLYFRRVQRIVVASLSRRPASHTEVAAWLGGKTDILPSPEVAVPIRSNGGF